MTRLLVWLVLSWGFPVFPVAASQIVHNAAAGETLESIALRYYGTKDLGTSLGTHNSLGASGVSLGSVIEIPLSDEHTLAEGEDWSILAARYWGDWELGPVMSALVVPRDPSLGAGTEIRVPGLIHHRVRRGESLTRLSRLVYDNADRAIAIGKLNGIDDPNRLRVGQHLRLPVLGVARAVAMAPSPASRPKVVPAVSSPVRVNPSAERSKALVAAIESYYQGEFDEAREALEALRPGLIETGTEPQRRLLLEHLLRVYVAFDDAELACESWAQLGALDDDASFDLERFSPKIREVGSACATP